MVMTNPPKKQSGAEHNGHQNSDNKEKLQILVETVQTLIDNLISHPFFAKLLNLF
jgi:transcriptional regulator of NAD metabolism